MLKFLRFLRGYFYFVCEGTFSQKIISICAKARVVLWDLKGEKGKLAGCALQKDIDFLISAASEAGCDINIVYVKGAPKFIEKNKKRMGLAIGLALFLMIINVLSMFIWNIDINCSDDICISDTMQKIESLGIHKGLLKFGIDQNEKNREIMRNLNDTAWVSVNVDGVNLEIEISKQEKKPQILETETKSNIKAARSGQITEINTKSGTKECKIGDAVIKGQVLISGICEDILGGLRICHAEGEVIADTQYTVDISVPYNIKRTVLSKEYYEKNDVEILGVKIPVYFYYPEEKDFLTAQSNCAYCFSDTKIPVILKNTRLYPAKEECLTISEEQAKQTATMILQLKKLFCFSDKEIKDVKLKYIKDAKKLNLCAEINCSEDIGEQHELLLDENLRLSPDDPNEEAPQNNTDSG